MSSFCNAKATHIFQQKFRHVCVSLDVNFNESLTNDIISFEQLGPDNLGFHRPLKFYFIAPGIVVIIVVVRVNNGKFLAPFLKHQGL